MKPVIPRSRFYDGLGQALALTTCGVDYACLFHLFVFPTAAYRKLEARDPAHAEQIDDARAEFAPAYMGIVQGILERFELPLGYVALLVVADKSKASVKPMLPWKEPNQLGPSPAGDRVRVLLSKALPL